MLFWLLTQQVVVISHRRFGINYRSHPEVSRIPSGILCSWDGHRESMSIIVQQDMIRYILLYFCKLFYMFRVVTTPIIRSTYNCNYSTWHWFKLSLLPSAIVVKLELRSTFTTIAEGSRDSLISARSCNYSYMCS